ncbi:MAG: hypothetical protein R2911_18030 [Caldilineaceae bacterium]
MSDAIAKIHEHSRIVRIDVPATGETNNADLFSPYMTMMQKCAAHGTSGIRSSFF